MAITAAMVKELREMSGAGMMDCKKALTECDGDMDAAFEALRKSGAAKAAKKASRIAAEGICRVALDGNKGAVVEVNSETDFVAKNEIFQNFVQAIANQAIASSAATVEEMVAEKFIDDASKTLQDEIVEKTATIGEKLSFRRFEKIEGDCVVSYLHNGGKIGVLVAGNGAGNGDDIKEALQNIAMQIAAMNPTYVSRDDISQAEIDKTREITVDASLNDPASLPKPILNKLIEKAISSKAWTDSDIAIYEEKKSKMEFLFNFLSDDAKQVLINLAMDDKAAIMDEKVFSGAVEGRVSKQLKEVTLYDQAYVKADDGKQTVAAYLQTVSKDLKIAKFIRLEVGEGMEKKNEDFAAEVAAQLG